MLHSLHLHLYWLMQPAVLHLYLISICSLRFWHHLAVRCFFWLT